MGRQLQRIYAQYHLDAVANALVFVHSAVEDNTVSICDFSMVRLSLEAELVFLTETFFV